MSHGVSGRCGRHFRPTNQTPLLLPSLAQCTVGNFLCKPPDRYQGRRCFPDQNPSPVKGRMHLIENSWLACHHRFAHTADASRRIFFFESDERGGRPHRRLAVQGKGRLKAIADGQDCEQVCSTSSLPRKTPAGKAIRRFSPTPFPLNNPPASVGDESRREASKAISMLSAATPFSSWKGS
jgi:hypothetical protein